jgi:septum formation inhibitor MinC
MPPTATKKTTTRKRAAAKPAPAPEPEVDELEEDEDLDELEEDEVEDAPAKAKTQEVTFGVSDLCKYLTEKYDKKVTPRELRTLIRKMARDGKGRVDREITPGNRTRYDWPAGVKDPEVRQIIKAYASGELEADKQEKLQALKDRKAKKDAEKAPATKKTAAKKRAKPEPEEVDEDEDLDLEDDD